MESPAGEHRDRAARTIGGRGIGCAVLTVSDTRTAADDTSGDAVVSALTDAGHRVVHRALVRDEPADIEASLRRWIDDDGIAAILTTGGTGVSRRDTTIDVVRRLVTTPLDGFGELFRMLSYEEIGSAAMLSQAMAGLADDTFVFAMPGSTNAVRLAMTRLVIPELPHLIAQR